MHGSSSNGSQEDQQGNGRSTLEPSESEPSVVEGAEAKNYRMEGILPPSAPTTVHGAGPVTSRRMPNQWLISLGAIGVSMVEEAEASKIDFWALPILKLGEAEDTLDRSFALKVNENIHS